MKVIKLDDLPRLLKIPMSKLTPEERVKVAKFCFGHDVNEINKEVVKK